MNHFLLHKQEEYKSVEHNIAQETDVRIKHNRLFRALTRKNRQFSLQKCACFFSTKNRSL